MFVISNAACSRASTLEQLSGIDSSASDRVVTTTCTLTPRAAPKRSSLYPSYLHDGTGAVNNKGMKNDGYSFYKELRFKKPYVVSIAGSVDEIAAMMMDGASRANFYEINISCPNVHNDFMGLQDLKKLFDRLRDKRFCEDHYHPAEIGIKMHPCLTLAEIQNCSEILNRFPISYVVCCNTIPRGLLFQDHDIYIGALSGKYVQPVTLWNVKTFREHLRADISVYGCGGISSKEDVLKYKKVGASGVQVATAFIENGPSIFAKL